MFDNNFSKRVLLFLSLERESFDDCSFWDFTKNLDFLFTGLRPSEMSALFYRSNKSNVNFNLYEINVNINIPS